MPTAIVECVPNFSEGKDAAKIKQITDAIEATPGATLLDVDPGRDTNRTVVTFVGSPEAAAEAAFQAIAKAAQVIDMSRHHGRTRGWTPRTFARSCPSRALRWRDSRRLPAASRRGWARSWRSRSTCTRRRPRRPSAATWRTSARASTRGWPGSWPIRAGSPTTARAVQSPHRRHRDRRPSFPDRLQHHAEHPRQGRRRRYCHGAAQPAGWPAPRRARPIIPAATSFSTARAVFPAATATLRAARSDQVERHCREEHGYELRELAACAIGDFSNVVGQKVRRAGKFRCCKAIGWYVDQYKRAQISINLTNYLVTPPHLVLEEARRLAADRGLVVTGSEVVGMVPYRAMLEAGTFYLARQGGSPAVPVADILEAAVFSMGLGDVQPFEIARKVIGLPVRNPSCLVRMRMDDFVNEVSRDTPAPGGGSIAALAGSLGAALSSMVANLTRHKAATADQSRGRRPRASGDEKARPPAAPRRTTILRPSPRRPRP